MKYKSSFKQVIYMMGVEEKSLVWAPSGEPRNLFEKVSVQVLYKSCWEAEIDGMRIELKGNT